MTASPTLRVLAVDDNSSLLRFLVSAFTANACAVTPAPTAERALELIGTEDFDLVVSEYGASTWCERMELLFSFHIS